METKSKYLLELLSDCAYACNNCSTACLSEKNIQEMRECIRLDMDCAQICAVTAAFISRKSDNAKYLIKMCAEICRKCATECEKHPDMGHCRVCADACEACANECNKAA